MNFLRRINFVLPLQEILEIVAENYKLGSIHYYEAIPVGYEDINIKLFSERGKFLVKIFSKERTHSSRIQYIQGLLELARGGVPVPRLQKFDSKYMFCISHAQVDIYLCVMDYFDGTTFADTAPSSEDITKLIELLARIHSLDYQPGENYDPWGTAHLIEEFILKGRFLDSDDYRMVKSIVNEFEKIDFTLFKHCVIHGDLQRNNVMKNSEGEYRILDMGSMTFGVAVIDLAIFIATFCFDINEPEKNSAIYNSTLRNYMNYINLSNQEINSLPCLIKATYAIFLIASNYALKVDDDTELQTLNWFSMSRRALMLFNEPNTLIRN